MELGIPKRVLLVDDDGVTRGVLAKLLGVRGYDVFEAESGAAALRELSQPNAPRLAVVDWNMGTINGPELCRILRGRLPYTFVVLTTAQEGRKPLVEAMHAGADGYVQKPADPDELEAWLVAGQRVVELHDRELEGRAELERRATHDLLTGTRNRGSLLEILGREICRTRRTSFPTGVVLFELDPILGVNETHGYPLGDDALIDVARLCAGMVRDYDAFGRFGKDEFLVVLPGCTTANAVRVADRLLSVIARTRVHTAMGELSIAAGAGVASTELGHLESQALLTAAEAALQESRRDGRARAESARPLAKGDSDFPPTEPDTMKAPD